VQHAVSPAEAAAEVALGRRAAGPIEHETIVDGLRQLGVLDDEAMGDHAQVVKVLDLLVLHAALSVLRDEDRDSRPCR
jgi:hypothetical protein